MMLTTLGIGTNDTVRQVVSHYDYSYTGYFIACQAGEWRVYKGEPIMEMFIWEHERAGKIRQVGFGRISIADAVDSVERILAEAA